MKIILNNFKCYKNKSFDVCDNSIVLINGISGSGKSSFFDAIYFCLYNEGRNIQTHGEKKAKVQVEIVIKNVKFNIIRSKGPNRLLLTVDDIEYEDDIAQGIIDKHFGAKNDFLLTSYMSQKIGKSFLSLSSSEKITFLEQLTSENIVIDDKKKIIKEKIKAYKEHLVVINTQKECVQLEYSKLKKPQDTVEPQKNILQTKEQLKKLIEEGKKELNLKQQIIVIEDKILEFDLKHLNIDNNTDTTTLKNLIEQYELIKKYKKYISIKEKYKADVNRYNAMVEYEIKSLEEQKNKLEECLLHLKIHDNPSSLLNKVNSQIQEKTKLIEYQKALEDEQEVNFQYDTIKEKWESIKQNITALKQSLKNISCPHCGKFLQISGADTIIKSEENTIIAKEVIKQKLAILTKEECSLTKEYKTIEFKKNEHSRIKEIVDKYPLNLNHLKLNIHTISLDELKKQRDGLTNDLEIYNKYIQFQKQLQEVIRKIETEDYGSAIQREYNTISQDKKELDKLKPVINSIDDTIMLNIEELSEKISQLTIQVELSKQYKKQRDTLVTELKNLKKEISLITISGTIEYNEHLLQELINVEIQTLKYAEYVKDKQAWEYWENKLNSLIIEHTKLIAECHLYEKLYRFITEAESISLEQVIETINMYVNEYLQYFFPDESISVEMKNFKELKSKKEIKSDISINVDYKGVEDCLGLLSKGEYARVELAFLLALNKIICSPLLILDENLSCLHSGVVDDILQYLLTLSKVMEKTILIVSHQVSSGIFEQVIEI